MIASNLLHSAQDRRHAWEIIEFRNCICARLPAGMPDRWDPKHPNRRDLHDTTSPSTRWILDLGPRQIDPSRCGPRTMPFPTGYRNRRFYSSCLEERQPHPWPQVSIVINCRRYVTARLAGYVRRAPFAFSKRSSVAYPSSVFVASPTCKHGPFDVSLAILQSYPADSP